VLEPGVEGVYRRRRPVGREPVGDDRHFDERKHDHVEDDDRADFGRVARVELSDVLQCHDREGAGKEVQDDTGGEGNRSAVLDRSFSQRRRAIGRRRFRFLDGLCVPLALPPQQHECRKQRQRAHREVDDGVDRR